MCTRCVYVNISANLFVCVHCADVCVCVCTLAVGQQFEQFVFTQDI